MLLHYIHVIFLLHLAIYFLKCTSPSCIKASPQHDAANLLLHGWDGVLWLKGLPLFPPNITMDISPKSTIFVPNVQLQSVAWLFYGGFVAVASSLLSGISGYIDIRLILLWI